MEPLERDVETLRNIPLFAGLATARLKLIAYAAEIVHFGPGELIVQQGDPADAVYIVTEGEADVELRDGQGHDILLATMGRHSLFGETAVLSKKPRSASVKAETEVELMVVTSEILSNALGLNHWMGAFVRALAERFREADDRLRSLERPKRRRAKR